MSRPTMAASWRRLAAGPGRGQRDAANRGSAVRRGRVRLAGPVVPDCPRVRPGPARAARQDGARPPRRRLVQPRRRRVVRVRRRLPAPPRAALRGPRRRQGQAPVRVPRLVLRRRRRLPVHPPGAGGRPPGAQEPQGVRGVVPVRRAERSPVVLPEDGGRVQGRAAEEAAAVLRRDRRPVVLHRVRHERISSWDHQCRYDVLVENLFDPAHVPYAHKGLLPNFRDEEDPGRVEHDQECGDPITMKIDRATIDGFLSTMKGGSIRFVAPCTFHGTPATKVYADGKAAPWFMLVAFCIPVAPGRSRLIWAFPRNAGVWLHKIMPRWFSHSVTNRVLDSDICLIHFEERRVAAVGLDSWHKACYVPTSSDGMVVAFRNWFRKYCKHQVGWGTPQVD
ncbi:hypothetical protein GQ55_9G042800 [Panicum hallii var. hallii]|uniref:Pheophorbide a oxygenase domain-containing protein n=1 Tax=Panicum hallii var. hallii TaxID=1504633 RepID=A0A2T7BZI7_9POAL|nr:hypothetical protein GQ55_9G042800 [Panicum hallii var. hallii]